MSATVVAFPNAITFPKEPLRFTVAERNAIMAAGYKDGLCAVMGACEDGDEWGAISPVGGEFHALDAVGIAVTLEGFKVFTGMADLGTFDSVQEAVAVARRDMVGRMDAFDPLDGLEAWRGVFASLDANRAG